MPRIVELERLCIRDYSDVEMTLPEAIKWLQDHLAKVPPEDRERSFFRGSMETGYYGEVDCFIEIGFFTENEP